MLLFVCDWGMGGVSDPTSGAIFGNKSKKVGKRCTMYIVYLLIVSYLRASIFSWLQNTGTEYDGTVPATPPSNSTSALNCSNWTSCHFDEADYIRTYLGWRYRSVCESATLTVVYATILLTGVVGNVSTCVVIATNRAMHSPTNFYLLSLAVSDVLTLCLGACRLCNIMMSVCLFVRAF